MGKIREFFIDTLRNTNIFFLAYHKECFMTKLCDVTPNLFGALICMRYFGKASYQPDANKVQQYKDIVEDILVDYELNKYYDVDMKHAAYIEWIKYNEFTTVDRLKQYGPCSIYVLENDIDFSSTDYSYACKGLYEDMQKIIDIFGIHSMCDRLGAFYQFVEEL